ncbi:hypothetical protein [Bacteroides sp. 51]|uniref:hypothetical protein n=1 Tax=Bacteroides sp. 51 TaxID=2302938 RepID=UPI0013CFD31B|nr:hypothetical protein [Bacteroides sp. 51]
MKTMKNYAVLVLVSFIFCNFTHRVSAQEGGLYQSSMEKALTKLDEVKNIADLMDCRNLFERIAQKFGDKWQPVYYTAYCDIQMVYYDKASEHNSVRLSNAQKELEKLDCISDADKSEVSTLWGYYYNAQIMLNPGNAQTIFGQVIGAYERALGINPENPRAVILRTFFNQFLPPMVKLKIDASVEVEKAKTLFAKQEKGIDKPYWGESFVNYIKIEN